MWVKILPSRQIESYIEASQKMTVSKKVVCLNYNNGLYGKFITIVSV